MRFFSIVLLVTAALSFSSCKKDENPVSSNTVTYTNKITFGAGLSNGNILTEEGTTFTRTNGKARIYYRVESTVDLATTGILVHITKKTDTSYTYIKDLIADKYIQGHSLVQYFDVTDAGTYRVIGLLYTTQAQIASATCTVK